MCPIRTVCVAFADCHYHTLLQDSALLFVYALHFFLLTQPALGPPACSSCVVPATARSLHGTEVAQRAWLLEQRAARPGISTASSQHGSAIPICAAPTTRAPLGSAPQPGGDHGPGCPHWLYLHIGVAMKKNPHLWHLQFKDGLADGKSHSVFCPGLYE